ncbi:sel1 repeat family protein [Pseudoalteromonas sp. SCSIO 43088]|uniref:tetratricopeptide repeat protein n=1 Tax=Pseudoalteromonas sp. SCSIO 43088 TaxID=2822846 RepID=UPI00202B1A5F|nr:tetratricopeptide repeat protein [Pseudoalteromonas sp. SCSIO 43088]URQ87869.1 sel1 repeat family protein [Pseudoalteromonas sp. SCSIO 43088]
MKKLFLVKAIIPLVLLGCVSSKPDVEGELSQENSTGSKTKLVKNMEQSTVEDKANHVLQYREMIYKKRSEESRQLRNYRSMSISGEIAPLLEASEKGEDSAMYALGIAYFFGKGVVKNDEESTKWLLKAASLGHTEAQAEIGHRYGTGLGVVKNEKEEIDWYRKAIKQGSPEAMLYLAWDYSKGRSVDKDIERAYSLYLLARDQGRVKAKEHIEKLAKVMTKEQIIGAKDLYYDCLSSFLGNCG